MKRTHKLILAGIFFYLVSFIYRTIYWEDFYLHYQQILINSLFDTSISFLTSILIFKLISEKIKFKNSFYRISFFILCTGLIYFINSKILIALHYFGHTITTGMTEPFSTTFKMESFQIFDTYVVIAVGSLIFLASMILDRYYTEKIIHEKIEKEFIQQQVQHLKTQIGPHFLFNTLNNLYYLIDIKNQSAREIVLKLSDILRYQLYETNCEKIALSKELEYIKDYIDLQNIRKEADFKLNFKNEIDKDIEISPLILIVLLENAYKFTGSESKDFIDVHLSIDAENSFTYSVKNSINEKSRSKGHLSKGNGLGLMNLKNRLQIVYGNNASLDINENDSIYEASVKIKHILA